MSGKGRKNGNVGAKDGEGNRNNQIFGEFRIGQNVDTIEKFRNYLKFIPKEGGWILRIPPSKVVIIPDTKERAAELMKLYKSIIKEKGRVLQENIDILKRWIGDTEIIKQKRVKKNQNSKIKELQKQIEELQKQISKLTGGDE